MKTTVKDGNQENQNITNFTRRNVVKMKSVKIHKSEYPLLLRNTCHVLLIVSWKKNPIKFPFKR